MFYQIVEHLFRIIFTTVFVWFICLGLFEVSFVVGLLEKNCSSGFSCALYRYMMYLYSITLTSLCNLDPYTPHFYIGKLGFSGLYATTIQLEFKS